MTDSTRKPVRGIFGALVVGALGLGASQAAATPAAAAASGYCTIEQQTDCMELCAQTYGLGYRGRCSTDARGSTYCQCFTHTAG